MGTCVPWPSCHKYMFLNSQAISMYRSYNKFVTAYLHGCPRQVIAWTGRVTVENTVKKTYWAETPWRLFSSSQGHQEKGKKLNNQLALAQIGYNGIFHANIYLYGWRMGLGVSTRIIQIKPSPHSNTLTGSPKDECRGCRWSNTSWPNSGWFCVATRPCIVTWLANKKGKITT